MSDVLEAWMFAHGLVDFMAHIRHGVADGLHHQQLFFEWDAETVDDELLQMLARQPGFFAHEFNGGRIVGKACINMGCEHVVGGGQMHIASVGIEKGHVFRMAIRIAQGVGQQQGRGQLAEGFHSLRTRHMDANGFGDALPSGVVLG